jgi:hypothetical protein
VGASHKLLVNNPNQQKQNDPSSTSCSCPIFLLSPGTELTKTTLTKEGRKEKKKGGGRKQCKDKRKGEITTTLGFLITCLQLKHYFQFAALHRF